MRHLYLRSRLAPAAYLLLAALALANGGCLLVAAGAAAGGAAAGYAYYKGKVCETYNASLDDTFLALHSALGELGMPILSEEREGVEGSIKSQTAAGERVHLDLQALTSKIPAEGQVTRLSVRVATFGDELVSSRILAQVGFHLAPAGVVGQATPAPPASGVIRAGAAAPVSSAPPAQTAPPPLLPPEPVPARK